MGFRLFALVALVVVGTMAGPQPKPAADVDPHFGHWFADMHPHLDGAELFKLAHQVRPSLMAWSQRNTSNPWVTDTIVGPNAPTDGTAPTLKVAYAHPLYMRSGVKKQATLFVNHECLECIVYLVSGGVLDPANMDTWPAERKGDVLQLYSTVEPYNWFAGQLGSLNKVMNKWAIKHGTVLQDDLPRQSVYESYMPRHSDNTHHWTGATWLASTRSTYFNETMFRLCGIPLPPPFNDTRYQKPYATSYGWKEHRDIIIALAECGVLEPLIMEECMPTPWWISVLHAYNVPLIQDDGVTSGWRLPGFIQAFEEVLWPILHAVAKADPTQRMLKRWINWASQIMQQYAAAMALGGSGWPADKPAPLPRSECGLATKVLGMSSHFAGTDSKVQRCDSAGPVNCLIGWIWSKGGSYVTPAASALADRWISYVFDYTRPEVLANDLAPGGSVAPLDSIQDNPTVAARAASVQGQIGVRMLKKGRPMNWPNAAMKYTNLLEGTGLVSKLLYDTGFVCDILSTDPAVIRACALSVQNRGATQLEWINKPDCVFPDDTESAVFAGVKVATWKTGPNVTCRVSDQAVRLLAANPEASVVVDCVHPHDTLYVDDNCAASGDSLLTTVVWNRAAVGTTCLVTNYSLSTLPTAPESLPCPYVAQGSSSFNGIAAAVTVVSVAFVVVAVYVVQHKNAEAIKASSWKWSMVLLASCLVMALAALAELGERTNVTCTAFLLLMSVGEFGVLASLFVKVYRIAVIFLSKVMKVEKLSDGKLVLPFSCIMFLNAVMFISWVLSAGASSPLRTVTMPPPYGLSSVECNYDQPAVFIIWLVIVLGAIVADLVLGWMVREVDDKFNDTKTLLAIAVLTGFIGGVCLVMLGRTQLNADRSILKALIAIFNSTSIVAIYFGFKFYYVFAKPGGRSSAVPDRTRAADGSTLQTVGAKHNSNIPSVGRDKYVAAAGSVVARVSALTPTAPSPTAPKRASGQNHVVVMVPQPDAQPPLTTRHAFNVPGTPMNR